MATEDDFSDGYDLSFCHMLLAADARAGRDYCHQRQHQCARMQQDMTRKRKLLEKNGFDDFSEEADVPLDAVITTVCAITNCERKISGRSTWDQAKLWCEDVLAEYAKNEQARAQRTQYVPARSPLTREQTLALMDHIGACDKLLNGD